MGEDEPAEGVPVAGRFAFASTPLERRWPWCRFSFHAWTFFEDVGTAPYHGTGKFQVVQERTCQACGHKHRRFAGWATMIETNAEYAEAQQVAASKLRPRNR